MKAGTHIPRVFISYKVLDHCRNSWVEKLCRDLRANGVDAKLDIFEVAPGGSFSDYMTRSVREADCILFVVTPEAVGAVESGNGAVAFEMQIANARRLSSKGKFSIVPIFREGETTSTYLQDHKYLDFREDHHYQAVLQELVDWLHGRVSPPPIGPAPDEVRLYKRAIMRPYGFFGGKQTPIDVVRALRTMEQLKVIGFSTEHVDDESTWVPEGGDGGIRLDDSSEALTYRRFTHAGLSWDAPWRKNFFTWELRWQDGVVATCRFATSPVDR